MKLYTKTGDDGTTGLLGGRRVGKDTLCIEVCGAVDELNCAIGVARVACRHRAIGPVLEQTQRSLFDLGAVVAGGEDQRIGAQQVAWAEAQIDTACAAVEPMRHFILPGGSELAARLHLARAVCRRAERLCVQLSRQERGPEAPGAPGDVLVYLNRLSDLLFALARWANTLDGVADVAWEGRG